MAQISTDFAVLICAICGFLQNAPLPTFTQSLIFIIQIKGMKKSILLYAFLLGCLAASAQGNNPKYDKLLADSLHADEYGMKMYVLAILKTGTAKETDKKMLDSLMTGHMNNIGRLAREGMLVVAGPLQKNDRNYRGIFILNVRTVEEAKRLVQTDPAVAAGIFDTELFGWYGSAALPMYLPYSEKTGKKSM